MLPLEKMLLTATEYAPIQLLTAELPSLAMFAVGARQCKFERWSLTAVLVIFNRVSGMPIG